MVRDAGVRPRRYGSGGALVADETARVDALALDANWLYTVTTLGLGAWLLDDASAAAALYPRLLPYAERVALAGRGTHCTGSVKLPLGLLAAAVGDDDRAERQLADAVRINDRLGARPFAAAAATASRWSSSVAGSPSARQHFDPRRSVPAESSGCRFRSTSPATCEPSAQSCAVVRCPCAAARPCAEQCTPPRTNATGKLSSLSRHERRRRMNAVWTGSEVRNLDRAPSSGAQRHRWSASWTTSARG